MPSSGTNRNRTVVRGLGEIALRVNNLDTMQKFYEEIIGLPLMTRVPNCAFFKFADGYGGHTQVLALFDRAQTSGYRGTDATTSTIDHIAFEIAKLIYPFGMSDRRTIAYAYVPGRMGTALTGDPRYVALREALFSAVSAGPNTVPGRPQAA